MSKGDRKSIPEGLEGQVDEDASSDDEIVAPDQFDPAYETTRKELWSYYVCPRGVCFRTDFFGHTEASALDVDQQRSCLSLAQSEW